MPVRPVFTSLRPTFRTSTLRTPLLGLLAFSLAACGGDQTQESPTTEAQPDAGSAAAPEIAAEFSTALLRGLIRDETVRVQEPLGVNVGERK